MSDEETTYVIERAASGRAKCKGCKNTIEKNDLRIGVEVPNDNYKMVRWYHTACFKMPTRKLKGVSIDDFIEDILRDGTKDDEFSNSEDLKTKVGNDIQRASYGSPSKNKKKRGKEEDAEEQEAKKRKIDAFGEDVAEKYNSICGKKNDELKDILRWNGHPVTGTKENLLERILDGIAYGRFQQCPLCHEGKLKLKDDDLTRVVCRGRWDEALMQRFDCAYSVSAKDAPRNKPWHLTEPSALEKEEIKQDAERRNEPTKPSATAVAATNEGGGIAEGPLSKLLKGAAKLEEDGYWDLNNAAGIKKASSMMTDLVLKDGVIDITDDEKKARMLIGKLILTNKDKSASEFVTLLADQQGLSENNQAQKKQEEEVLSEACAVPANAKIVMVLMELSKLYFKEKNTNAGLTYKKVANAIRDHPEEITVDNAKGLGKGKTKVPGIGGSSAAKIHEFLSTGTIQKLEEKRASVGDA